ncbi:MAG TPA: protocatechuate 3,4-dioxygenase subunit alpha [Mycobacteriales bacterium]|jgi:protocatechuate 3,4-dioxygenase alpha subunit|nr:protocatechuate 3,4-dioxygenase subunit alpha [Mycobacteriales bacterium]
MTEPLPSTPGQTVGPFFGLSLPYGDGPRLVPPGHPDAVRLHGRVLDGAGDPVPDALLELWQPGPDGAVLRQPGSLHRDGWTFTGWGRAATDNAGQWSFSTLRPGSTRPGGAPFFALTVFARGLLDRLWTRIYLPGAHPDIDPALAADPLLSALPAERRATLIATVEPAGYAFDVVLQGERETVFLDTAR